jgi:hypothetical protein
MKQMKQEPRIVGGFEGMEEGDFEVVGGEHIPLPSWWIGSCPTEILGLDYIFSNQLIMTYRPK